MVAGLRFAGLRRGDARAVETLVSLLAMFPPPSPHRGFPGFLRGRSCHKTGAIMNSFPPHPSIPVRGLFGAPLALALLLVGCASGPAAGPPPSAAMTEARALAAAAKSYPRFSDIPVLPADERPLAAWGRAAGEVLAEGAALVRDGAEDTWTLRQTDAFAAQTSLESGPAAPSVSATAAADAFARDVRKRATPPPPPPR